MLLHRVCRTIYARDLSGTGSRLYGGRWNSAGLPVLYTSGTVSLAMLETVAHTPYPAMLKDFSIVGIRVPEDSGILDLSAPGLPKGWDRFPAPASLAIIGDKWLLSLQSLLMKVPSVVVPAEYNYLINPQHPDMRRVRIASVEPLVIDIRVAQHMT